MILEILNAETLPSSQQTALSLAWNISDKRLASGKWVWHTAKEEAHGGSDDRREHEKNRVCAKCRVAEPKLAALQVAVEAARLDGRV